MAILSRRVRTISGKRPPARRLALLVLALVVIAIAISTQRDLISRSSDKPSSLGDHISGKPPSGVPRSTTSAPGGLASKPQGSGASEAAPPAAPVNPEPADPKRIKPEGRQPGESEPERDQAPAVPGPSGPAWTKPIRPNPAIDAKSPSMVASLSSDGTAHANLYEFGIPIYAADSSTPKHRVLCTEPWGVCPLERTLVPIPSDARPHSGSDGAMVVVDLSTQQSYEFWRARRGRAGWQTAWGRVVNLDGDGQGGATASGLSRLAGVVRTSEMTQGHIEHALAFSSNNTCRNSIRYPAIKTDGRSSRPDCIPQGARIQLDPHLDLDSLPELTKGERIVARALQTYGAYVVDHGSVPMAFSFELPENKSNPYPEMGFSWDFYGMSNVPWDKLRVLRQWNGG